MFMLLSQTLLFGCLAIGSLVAVASFFYGAHLGRRLGHVPFVKRRERWAIGLYGGDTPFSLQPLPDVANPVLTADDVTDVDADFVADPFMIQVEDTWYMFFEVLNSTRQVGEIAVATSSDAQSWTYGQVVLREPFHLSYPKVFAWEGALYMLPETRGASSLRLYRSTDFPTQWQCVATLLSEPVDDATPFFWEGRWWMFAGVWFDTLRLFMADSLLGPWTEHPKSPLLKGNLRTARPAGSVIIQNGFPVRFTQDCEEAYGTRVRAFRITTLTESDYEEVPVAEGEPILAGSNGWNRYMHHLDLHQTDVSTWLACVDGYTGQRHFKLGI
jgi:hypothetical protein